jgi:hypothetical protein
MKRPFTPLRCAVMVHIKPKNQQTWDFHVVTGLDIGTAMGNHQCFHTYIVKTRTTRISDTVLFKHQYITNLHVTSKTLVIKVVLELTSALKGSVSRNGETAEPLKKFSDLFTKIAMAKLSMVKAKVQWNNLQTHPNSCQAVPLPRVVNRPPIPAGPLPRVPVASKEAECHVRGVGRSVQTVGTVSQVTVLPTQFVNSQSQVQTNGNVTSHQ